MGQANVASTGEFHEKPPSVRRGKVRGSLVWCIRWIHRHYDLDAPSLVFLVVMFVIFGISYLFMNVMSNVASNRSPDNRIYPQLPDAGFDGIPQIDALWLTDFFDYILLVPAILLVVTRPAPLLVLCKVILAWLLTNLMRITTVAITSYPDPRAGCVKHEGDPFKNVSLHRCGDCMFSGHTILYVISSCVWFSYAPPKFIWRVGTFLTFCGAFAGGIIIIANRAHYTSDVLVAIYCTVGAFYFVRWHWRYLEGVRWLRRINAPNGRVFAAEEDWRMVADTGPWEGGWLGEGRHLHRQAVPAATQMEQVRRVQEAEHYRHTTGMMERERSITLERRPSVERRALEGVA